MEPRLGRNPHIYHPPIRQSTWIRTLGLCQNEEQLRKVIDMIPLWRDMDLKFDTTFSHAFIRTLPSASFPPLSDFSPFSGRCLYLNKPEFALELFCDFGKYNVPFTLDGAREILSVTYDKQSIGFIITLTRLFNVYKLGPVKNDYPCCAMVIAACLKSKRKDAMILADTSFLISRTWWTHQSYQNCRRPIRSCHLHREKTKSNYQLYRWRCKTDLNCLTSWR